jgi:hypothetical protein
MDVKKPMDKEVFTSDKDKISYKVLILAFIKTDATTISDKETRTTQFICKTNQPILPSVLDENKTTEEL